MRIVSHLDNNCLKDLESLPEVNVRLRSRFGIFELATWIRWLWILAGIQNVSSGAVPVLLPSSEIIQGAFFGVASGESKLIGDPRVSINSVPVAVDKATLSFNRDIRPILSENCYACHGPDAEAREAGLRLDVEAWAFKKREEGPPAIVRGKPGDSPIYKRITNPLKSEIMPPHDTNKVLSQGEKELIRRWIEQGAKWEGHWAFIKPQQSEVPAVSWGNNEIDKFIFVGMKEQNLSPNKEADRTTLARRLSLDLTGLPPLPGMVDAFVNDNSINAYENLVDRLLNDPGYGEHQAHYWLDAARYADTHGLHFDNYREIWPYRDWVIDAFNANKPFDEFVVEQIAGDLLPNPTVEKRLATGFNRCNPTTSEGGAIDEEYRAIYAKDRVETTATVFLGLTLGCASCHDHKFDPFSQKDFYRFAAFFNNLNGPIMDGNSYDSRPSMVLPQNPNYDRLTQSKAELDRLNKALATIKEEHYNHFETWLIGEDGSFSKKSVDRHVRAELLVDGKTELSDTSRPKTLRVKPGDSVDLKNAGISFNPDQPFTLACTVRTPMKDPKNLPEIVLLEQFDGNRGWRLFMENPDIRAPKRYRFTFELIHSKKENELISVSTQSDRWTPVREDYTTLHITYDGSRNASGLSLTTSNRRQKFDFSRMINNLTGPVATSEKLTIGITTERIPLEAGTIKNIRFFDRLIYPFEISVVSRLKSLNEAFKVATERRSPSQKRLLENYYFYVLDPDYRRLKFQQAEKENKYNFYYDQSTVSLVMEETSEPPFAFLLERGEYDKKGEKVFPEVPESLGSLPQGASKSRLGLARWLIGKENPLTARVTVNRFWQNLFGIGLVATSEDFGVMGERPTHPELLDWLAIRFQESGWDVKSLIKLMVTSATYRQNSRISREKLAIDRDNRFLARGSRYRLDGEVLRDQALCVSGRLNRKIGGPPVRPYQPEGIWKSIGYSDSNTALYTQGSGEDLYRRSIYTFWKRTAPPPSLAVFDTPSRETCTVRRERTNTPLQALTLMNDPQYVEAARNLAERAMLEKKTSPKDYISSMYEYAFGLKPTKIVVDVLHRSYNQFAETFDRDHDEARSLIEIGDSLADPGLDLVELASLTLVASQIMNLDSFLNKY